MLARGGPTFATPLAPSPLVTSRGVPLLSPTRRELITAAATAGCLTAATAASATTSYPTSVRLADGLSFPLASFGLQIYDDAMAEELTLTALECGFRNFFASVLARNQKGFARAVKKSGIQREELFICGSVVSNRAIDEETAYKLTQLGCTENMQAFAAGDIASLDMIMLDYPGPDDACIRGQWRAFEEMKAAGLVKSLAVSNFTPRQLDVVLAAAASDQSRPTVNQLPLCVGYHDPGIIAANARRRVHVQAWSPLGNGRLTRYARDAPATREACERIGARYGKSAYQVGLRFLTQMGASFAVEARSAAHFRDDLALFDFQISEAEVRELEALNKQPQYEGGPTPPNA